MLCAKFGWNWLIVSGEKDDIMKSFYDNGNDDNDRQQILIRRTHLRLQFRWAKTKDLRNEEKSQT